ncbi:hypothetical protein [Halomarina pelagica]|uniref:hypothetical protein n=1 Tax=Halomarina pelagica TaxID=2961599 RepID=UPI0020C2B151|nr:hypothetical protein [Halomarina sp. BND7]
MTIEVRRGDERGLVVVTEEPHEERMREYVSVGPGLGTTFDGDRYVTPLTVVAAAADRRLSWSASGPDAALDRARRAIERRAPAAVWLREYPILREVLPPGAASRLTCELALAAGASGAPLVVSMDARGRRGASRGTSDLNDRR